MNESADSPLRRTPLHARHLALGARLVPFGGWDMPVQYAGITREHLAVRRAAGLFDICHMGEVQVAGPDAANFLNQLLTNDVKRLAVGQGQYTLMCREDGGTVDDLYAYRLGPKEYLLVINAACIEADVEWILARHAGWEGCEVKNISGDLGALALQGPAARSFIDACVKLAPEGKQPSTLKKNEITSARFGEQTVWVGCTGYTGEDGFELIGPVDCMEDWWDQVMAAGGAAGLEPAGLGARDTLRTEACYPLYGHELSATISPLEAGLGFAVALDKGDFPGGAVLRDQKLKGPSRRSVAFRMQGRSAPPRPDYPVWLPGAGGRVIGTVTSGTQSPSLECGIGLALVEAGNVRPGDALEIEIRGRRWPALVERKPLYRSPGSAKPSGN